MVRREAQRREQRQDHRPVVLARRPNTAPEAAHDATRHGMVDLHARPATNQGQRPPIRAAASCEGRQLA
eukprot:6872728-Prymnesium_polylepis.1